MSDSPSIPYKPNDIIRFITPAGHDLQGKIVLMGDIWGLVHVDDPVPVNILLDLTTAMGKVVKV